MEHDAHVLRLTGALDISRVDELRRLLNEVPPETPHVVLDLSEVTSIESMLLGSLLLAQFRWDQEGRTVATVVPEGNVLRVLGILNVLRRLNVVSSLDDALRPPKSATPR